jgi:hypothetical protein
MAQCIGSLIVCPATFASAMASVRRTERRGSLRVTEEGQPRLDIDQHGIRRTPTNRSQPWPQVTEYRSC